jgi:hypothetical protein
LLCDFDVSAPAELVFSEGRSIFVFCRAERRAGGGLLDDLVTLFINEINQEDLSEICV